MLLRFLHFFSKFHPTTMMTTTRFRISPLLSAIGRVPVLLAVTIVLTTKPAGVTGLATAPTSSTNTVGMPPPLRLKQLLEAEMEGTRSTTSSGNGNEDESSSPILLPCCYDGLTARLIARAGFEATFMTGFGVSAVHGVPDTQLLSYGEMHQHATIIAEALASVALEAKGTGSNTNGLPIPCIADGDTGYGNAVNVKRTVFGYGRAGMAGIMIEDQVAPKRCGHVAGKSIVSFDDAVQRIQAACDARDEYEAQYGPGTGPLILARTDAVAVPGEDGGFEAAITRCQAFRDVGCDMTFLEAPESLEHMHEYCRRVEGPKLANMLEQGATPVLSPQELKAMGYTMAAYPLTLVSASIHAMTEALDRIRTGQPTDDRIATFATTKDVVGFTQYAREEQRYTTTE